MTEALSKVGGGQKVYDYAYTYNGFAAKLTAAQAAEARQAARMSSRDGRRAPDDGHVVDARTSSD